MSVARQSPRKRKVTATTMAKVIASVTMISWIEARTKVVES